MSGSFADKTVACSKDGNLPEIMGGNRREAIGNRKKRDRVRAVIEIQNRKSKIQNDSRE
jgi:hypothetical protein